MILPDLVQQIFEREGIDHECLGHSFDLSSVEAANSLQLNPDHVAQATMLRDELGMVMAIYPATTVLDLDGLNLLTKRALVQMTAYQIREALPVCEDGVPVPIAKAYNVRAIVDNTLMDAEQIYLLINAETMCGVNVRHFIRLQGMGGRFDLSFTRLRPQPAIEEVAEVRHRQSMRERVERLRELPPMPGIALEILQLRDNAFSNATDLGAIIEQDPSLSAQLIRYARSPFYGYRGEIDSIQDAISRVLGFDMVMDMALGVSVGKAFRNPESGRLGLNNFWRHATYCALLVQRLGDRVSGVYRPRPGIAYLSGLLHNMGYLLMGHLFPREFKLLNEAVTRHPTVDVVELEKRVLKVTHMEMGAWLMEAWNMHDELVLATSEHHNEAYSATHAVYPNLVLIANRMLFSMGVGEESSDEVPIAMLKRLGLSQDDVIEVFDEIMKHREGLDYMAQQMAA
jgi:HD-like signal output (HDOD) protein/prolyl-tRNA editing enzyme YbaK/EbsC (Cys-tRNA(Pro) deacylase)